MTDYWQADITITFGGTDHVLRELSPTAQARVFAALGRGTTTGPISAGDFMGAR